MAAAVCCVRDLDDPDEFRVVVEQVAVVHFETDQET
jgi:hypothetical protein